MNSSSQIALVTGVNHADVFFLMAPCGFEILRAGPGYKFPLIRLIKAYLYS